jgi:hypothetical protein
MSFFLVVLSIVVKDKLKSTSAVTAMLRQAIIQMEGQQPPQAQ